MSTPTQQHDDTEPEPPAETIALKNLIYRTGDVLTAKEEYIVHQCNCITTTTAGLARVITSKFPYAAPYSNRRPDPCRPSRCLPEDVSKPGTIQVWRSPTGDSPHFIGLFAQYEPGKPSGDDSECAREEWFKYCLTLIEKVSGVKSIAIPWQIGCGLAGGNWKVYEEMIREWAERHPDILVVIYKLEDSKGAGSRGGRGGRGRSRG
jgi:O-acetyl-ADP-ribose deacetylase (regulator of RNase III)